MRPDPAACREYFFQDSLAGFPYYIYIYIYMYMYLHVSSVKYNFINSHNIYIYLF